MKTSANTYTITSNSSGVANATPGKRRRMLLISAAGGLAFDLQFGTQPDTTHGIRVTATDGYIRLCHYEMGDALDGSFTMIDAAGSARVFTITEVVESL